MTSKEISHLVSEDHKNVMVVLSKGLISAGINPQDYFTLPKTRAGKQRRVLMLPYEVCVKSMATFTPTQFKKVVDVFAKWHEDDNLLGNAIPF